ncbi:hypothetical protein ACRCUN_29185 [Mycobacterium sp. LTG2003]
MGIFDSIADRGRELASFDPGAWTALAAWVAIAVVIVALIYAWRQFLKAKERRAELTQPNVAMFMEPSSSDWHLVELVIRNYGQRPAYGLRFEFANPPTVGKYESSYDDNYVDIVPLNLPAEIPYLAPSQEWRIVWDSALDRKQLGEAIASRFDGAITYYDEPVTGGKSTGKKFRNTAVLDWATLPPVDRMELLTTHDRARQEKQKLELLRGVLAYFQYAAKETDEQTLRSEINRIKALGAEVRERWKSRYDATHEDDDEDFDDDDPETDLINPPPVRTGRRHRAE